MSDTLQNLRRQKLRRLRAAGDAYPNDFCRTDLAADLHGKHGDAAREALAQAPPQVAVAGRLMLRRRMGKAIFCEIQDMSGRLQLYVAAAACGEAAFAAADDWDIGDIVGCKGELFVTQTGELTARARELRLLAKCLQPPPEKRRGLASAEARWRLRHMSLYANPEEREVFLRRARVIRFMREFFCARGYYEAETPMLQAVAGGALARPFVAHCNALDAPLYLRVAQELYIKRLLVGGFERVFELNRNFRNEGLSPRHNPEFTMLEFNAAYEDCESFMRLTEELLHDLVVAVCGGEEVMYQGQKISFARPFARVSPSAALARARGYGEADLQSREFLLARLAGHEGQKAAQAAALSLPALQLLLFEKEAEETLTQPTFLIDYPAETSPLAKRRPDNPDFAERFELFVAGRELVNGFSEQNDPDLQDEVFRKQAKRRAAGDEEAMAYDADYIHALQCGLPPNAGGGIGVDRLVMLLTDRPAIRDVILFPQLRVGDKPEGGAGDDGATAQAGEE